MITVEHDGEAEAPAPGGVAAFEVTLMGGGRAAMLAVRAPADPDLAELERGALGALLSAGVVHGLDRGLVAETVASHDGSPRTVARATPPTPPVDGVLDLPFAEELRHEPLHTVAAGTLLGRCTPPTPGEPGVSVTGEPLPPAEPAAPALTAGEGAEAHVAGGVTVVRALIDGRPVVAGDRVGVEGVIRVAELAPHAGTLIIHGSLEVGADLPEGARITATGGLRVSGDASRAHLDAGGDVVVTGSCMHCEIRAGALGHAHQELIGALGEADRELASACAMADQLMAGAAAGGRRLPEREALRAVLAGRFPGVAPAVAEAARLLRAGAVVEERVEDAILGAAAALDALERDEHVTAERVASAALALARSLTLMRGTAGLTSGVEAAYMQACRVEARGALVLTGAGTYNVDAHVGGDLRATGAGATVRGGTLQVGGDLRTTELGAPGGAPVIVRLLGTGGGERLSAGVAHPGVEVVCGDRHISLSATALNLSVGFDEENRVVSSEDPLG